MILVSTIEVSGTGMPNLVVLSNRYCIVGKSQDGHRLAKAKHLIDIISDRIGAASCFWCLQVCSI